MSYDGLFKNILVPVDLGELSGLALRFGAVLAAQTGAKLQVLEVEELDRIAESDPRWGRFVEQVMEQERRHAARRLEEFVRGQLGARDGAALLLERGFASERILRDARRLRADLILMGTHGRSGLVRWMLGSVTEAVLKGARVPVLAVRAAEGGAAGEPAHARCTRVLCGLDARRSPWSDAALRLSGKLAGAFGASLIALKVIPEREFARLDEDVGFAEERERFEDQLPEPLRPLCPDFLVRGGAPARILLEEARALRADLLVIGSGRRGRRHGLGRDAARVLRLSPCPVLIVPD